MIPAGGLTLPDCNNGQLIAIGTDRTLSCTQALTTSLSPPSCPSGYALNATDGVLSCVAKGTGTTNADLAAAITNVTTKTTNLTNVITQVGSGGGGAQYCGITAASTKGHFIDGGAHGIAAAASLCKTLCGTGGHMCSVYELFESVANGALKDMDITESWVYMASWSQEFTGQTTPATKKDPGSGQSDNCGSYTYDTADRNWWGTTVEWKLGVSGQKALHFYTGPDPVGIPGTATTAANTHSVPCGSSHPIACCL